MENINNKHTFGKDDQTSHLSIGDGYSCKGNRPYVRFNGSNANVSCNAPVNRSGNDYPLTKGNVSDERGQYAPKCYQRSSQANRSRTGFIAQEPSQKRPDKPRFPVDPLPITPQKDGQFVYSSKSGKKRHKVNTKQSNFAKNQGNITSDFDKEGRENIVITPTVASSSLSESHSKSQEIRDPHAQAKEPMAKLIYNMNFVPNPGRPGDKFLLEALMMEAQIVHNEIVRRINQGENPYGINIDSLRKIVYFTHSGMIQHTVIHYLTDIQISYLLDEVIQSLIKLSASLELPMEHVQLKQMFQIRFLNFRRLGQTHWFDYQNNKIRLLGMPVGVNVTGMDVLAKFPSIKIGSVRLIRKGEGVFSISAQCFIPEKEKDEFNREVLLAFGAKGPSEETEDQIENVELTESQQASLDYSIIEALQAKYNRDKDADKYDNSPRFLKDIAS